MGYHERKAEIKLLYRSFTWFCVLMFLMLIFGYFFGKEGRYANVFFNEEVQKEVRAGEVFYD